MSFISKIKLIIGGHHANLFREEIGCGF